MLGDDRQAIEPPQTDVSTTRKSSGNEEPVECERDVEITPQRPPPEWIETLRPIITPVILIGEDANFRIKPWLRSNNLYNKVQTVIVDASVQLMLPIYAPPNSNGSAASNGDTRQSRNGVDGKNVFLEPSSASTFVIEAKYNVGKTHQLNAFLIRLLRIDPHMPILQLGARTCHAMDIATECNESFAKAGLEVDGEELRMSCITASETSVATRQVISCESIGNGALGDVERFKNGVLVVDEACSTACNMDSTGTIRVPVEVASLVSKLSDECKYVIFVGHDSTLTQMTAKLIEAFCPKRDVLHVRYEACKFTKK
jgi:hypothetical protein